MSASEKDERTELFKAGLDAIDRGVPARVALKPYYDAGKKDDWLLYVVAVVLFSPFTFIVAGLAMLFGEGSGRPDSPWWGIGSITIGVAIGAVIVWLARL